MEAIAAAKAEADTAFRSKDFHHAVTAYTRALHLCQQQPDPPDLHLLYSNRSGTV